MLKQILILDKRIADLIESAYNFSEMYKDVQDESILEHSNHLFEEAQDLNRDLKQMIKAAKTNYTTALDLNNAIEELAAAADEDASDREHITRALYQLWDSRYHEEEVAAVVDKAA